MLPLVVQSPASRWADEAIRDTVATIARQPAYQQSAGETLWGRFVEWVGSILRWLFELFAGSGGGRVVVTALFVLLVLVVVARIAINLRDDRSGARARRRAVARRSGRDLLAEAERYAQAGDFTMAAHALCAALLDAYAARGEVRLHASKTTGDYARELRRRLAPTAPAFQVFRLHYDRMVYGTARIAEADYRSLVTAAQPLLELDRAA